MACCTRPCPAATLFSTRIARRELKRWRRKGPDKLTRRLVEAVLRCDLPAEPTLLDVGGGVGAIHHELLDRGFVRAAHVDASAAYVAAAREEADRLGHGDRVAFWVGDFPALAETVPQADVVTLHRVVCCDPDYRGMLQAAAGRARRVVAFSYPRPLIGVRVVIAIINFSLRLLRSAFRVHAHPPHAMSAVLEHAGFRRVFGGGSWLWAVDVFERAVAGGASS